MPGEPDRPYEGVYAGFDSPVMRRVRAEASAEDIGQHSWVTAEQLRADMGRLRLTPALRLLDLGCGACGRRAARLAHRVALEEAEGRDGFERQQRYLDTVVELARRRSLSRVMYLAEAHGG